MKSVYIHIPFCTDICTYCDFTKSFYNKEVATKYLIELQNEINTLYKDEEIRTLYIGGGTPSSLDIENLKILFDIVSVFKLASDYEFTIECNVLDTDIEKLNLFKKNGVNRMSIGVQSFNIKKLNFLGRNHTKNDVLKLISDIKSVGINNISIDLIYGVKDETIDDLKEDIKEFLKLDINHISTYSLIIEEHTKLYIDGIKNIDEDLDYNMYQLIVDELSKCDFIHYEVSNFSKDKYNSKHNLTYWNNEEYYGFGCGASSYINNIRYDNTRGISSYINGKRIINSELLDKIKKIEYEFILGLRKIKGINLNDFKQKYDLNYLDFEVVKKLISKGLLVFENNNLFIKEEYIYVSNVILEEFIGGVYE